MSIGARIKELRLKRGFTQEQMAEQLGMNRANFSNYERDVATPPGETLIKIADLLKTTTDYLLGREQSQYPAWATSKDKRDFKKMLEEDAPVMFDGMPISDEDKEKIKRVIEALFWDAKKKNKRKPIEE